MSDPGKTTRNDFAVVVNDHGRHALWQAGLDLPAGWRRQSDGMSRQARLDALAGGGGGGGEPHENKHHTPDPH
ncbi:MAG: MbtH family NRPS accessory protein, partial [Streptosporangiaceae bacterium]